MLYPYKVIPSFVPVHRADPFTNIPDSMVLIRIQICVFLRLAYFESLHVWKLVLNLSVVQKTKFWYMYRIELRHSLQVNLSVTKACWKAIHLQEVHYLLCFTRSGMLLSVDKMDGVNFTSEEIVHSRKVDTWILWLNFVNL